MLVRGSMSGNDSINVLLHSSRADVTIDKGVAATLWDAIRNDRGANGVFCGMGVKSLEQFVEFMDDPLHIVAVGLSGGRPAAIVWLDCITDKTARIHFVTFRWAYGGVNMLVCKEIVKTLLYINASERGFMFDCLIGFTPAFNRLAIKFAHDVGFKDVGILPLGYYDNKRGISIDAVSTYCTRQVLEGDEDARI